MSINKNFVVKNGLEVGTNLIFADSPEGKVGIGTTNPEYLLHVKGGIGATDSFVSGISTTGVLHVGTAGTVIAGTDAGSVGVGTTNPQYKLHVIGGIGVTESFVTGVSTVLTTLRVGTGGTVLTVLGAGNSIGVGTASPQYLFHINSPVSTGQTALYVQGDVRITGELSVNNITASNVSTGIVTTSTLIVGTSGTVITTTEIGSVGIGSTLPSYLLDVRSPVSTGQTALRVFGDLEVTGITKSNVVTFESLKVTGISTFNNVILQGYVSAGNTTGTNNQVLVSTGVGVTWKDSGSLRNITTFTSTAAQTTFNIEYSVGTPLDVFITGVKLASTEFTATNGTSVVLNAACFGNELVEIITYNIDFPLSFTGITVKEEGSLVANNVNTLNFVGLAITAIATSGSASTISIDAQPPLYSGSQVTVGIITATTFVGALTGNASSATFATNAGIATFATNAGIATFATSSGIATFATNAGISTFATSSGISTFATSSGIATFATNAGISTFATSAGISTSVIGGIGSITQLQVTGISTFTNGPILVGTGTSTGTASQRLQVTGGAYVSSNVGIGTTNPLVALDVAGNIRQELHTPTMPVGLNSDIGKNWTQIEMGAGLEKILSLVYCGNGIVLAGSGDSSGDGDIYRSTDFGLTYTQIEMGAGLERILSLVYCGNGIVLAGSGFDAGDGDIYRSTDYGVTYTQIEMGAGLERIESLVYCGDGIVLAGSGSDAGDGDIYRSTDYGATFTKIEMGAGLEEILSLVYCGNGIVLAGSGDSSGDGDIYRSTDYGATFTKIEMGAGLEKILSLVYCGNGIVLAGSGSDAGDGDIYRSTDFGLTYTQIGMGAGLERIESLVYCGNGIVLAGSGDSSGDGDIYRSTDFGLTYTQIEMGAGLERILSLVYCGNGIVLAGSGSDAGDGDIYRSDVGFSQASTIQGIHHQHLTGNLGIGTINPTSKFHIVGNTLVTGVSTVTSLNATNINASGIITATSGFSGNVTGNINSSGVSTVTLLNATNINTSGIVTAIGGFVSTANTTPITIQLIGNQLTFNAVGIGSTTFTLF